MFRRFATGDVCDAWAKAHQRSWKRAAFFREQGNKDSRVANLSVEQVLLRDTLVLSDGTIRESDSLRAASLADAGSLLADCTGDNGGGAVSKASAIGSNSVFAKRTNDAGFIVRAKPNPRPGKPRKKKKPVEEDGVEFDLFADDAGDVVQPTVEQKAAQQEGEGEQTAPIEIQLRDGAVMFDQKDRRYTVRDVSDVQGGVDRSGVYRLERVDDATTATTTSWSFDENRCVCVVNTRARPSCAALLRSSGMTDAHWITRRWGTRANRASSPVDAVFRWYRQGANKRVSLLDSFDLGGFASTNDQTRYAVDVMHTLVCAMRNVPDEVHAALWLGAALPPRETLQALADLFVRAIRVRSSLSDGNVLDVLQPRALPATDDSSVEFRVAGRKQTSEPAIEVVWNAQKRQFM